MLTRIQDWVDGRPDVSRRQLSREVCAWMGWRNGSGKWQEGSCRKALARLNREGLLRLPEGQGAHGFRKRGAVPEVKESVAEVACALKELGEVRLVLVTSRYARTARTWRALMARHHYLGEPKACGAQVRYLIESSRYGLLGAISFRGGCLALKARDKWVGWSAAARVANVGRVIQNDRFLIVPTVQVANLASHVLGLARSRVVADWEKRYGVGPLLAETFVDPNRFAGTCYRAAGWEEVGASSGRRDGVEKKVLVRWLSGGGSERLRREPQVPLRAGPVPEQGRCWAEEEFSEARLNDPRLVRRLVRIADDFYNRSRVSVPEASKDKAGTMGAYRFFSNPKVNMEVILTPHVESTIRRVSEQRVVLAPQDTTTLDYRTHVATEGLGPTNTQSDRGLGLLLHDTLAFTPEGLPLGVLDAQCWVRDPEDRGKSSRRKETPIEQKESMKWLRSFRRVAEVQKLCPKTRLVSMGDRESDIYELFLEGTKDPQGPWLLVRAERTRQRLMVGGEESLWEHMARRAIGGYLQVKLPRRGNRPARQATMALRFGEVELQAPKDTGYGPVKVWAVYLVEVDGPDEKAVEWMLLTTAPVENVEDAKERVEWYTGRWAIEIYHRVLKSGCCIEDRFLGTADRLEACLGVDMVVAWRVYHLTMLGREKPDLPCTHFFEEVEWKALWCYCYQTPEAPDEPPTMREAVRMVGFMGGHLCRKADGMPGTECIWRGLEKLDVATDMYAVFTHRSKPASRRSYPAALLPPSAGP
jgi:hypothetical protein